MISVHDAGRAGALGELSAFRERFHQCLTSRADALSDLADAVLCADGPVASLAELSLVPEHRRGHGAGYDAINHGTIEVGRLRTTLARLPLPRAAGGRIALGVDVSHWLRPDAACSPERLFCHTYARGKGQAQMIPGWPYSFVAALETGRTSWTAVLDAVRLGPADDATAVTAAQLRAVVGRIIDAGHWQPADPSILIVADAGYDLPRLAFVLADLPVEVVGRIRSDRVMLRPAPPRRPGAPGRRAKHGGVFTLADPASWHTPEHTTGTDTTRYGHAQAQAWDRLHPRLTRRGPWLDHDGELPLVEGTVIRLQVEHLPGDRDPKPVWLWSSVTGASAELVDLLWQVFLRRFDLEHTFRLFKQTLGWTRPKLRAPESADRWTWLILTVHTQLRLARPLAEDHRRPWEKPVTEPRRLTPARVRRGFRNLHATTTRPAAAPKPSRPGPGRPAGSTNHHPATRYNVGKTVKRDLTLAQHRNHTG
ncbi:DDE superfamily endonuclease [Amycolatopsis sulphurea]|uniref:DDE superfamily endonuclease n=1 Tax=Amycolatopsis sulphurea TaxID=76022 RepID=A0A2A9FKA6_9PSEU|nr:DDE superfamily endonuclease [Amycolatopsis sulphurea]